MAITLRYNENLISDIRHLPLRNLGTCVPSPIPCKLHQMEDKSKVERFGILSPGGSYETDAIQRHAYSHNS